MITNLLSAEERAEGDFGEGLLIPHDGTYTGTFSERSTCTSDDNTKHHCDLATPFEITVLTPSRIEGRGRYPKVETFDCAACTFSDDWEDFTFVWLPSAEN